MFQRINLLSVSILCVLVFLVGCVAKKNTILPTKYDREMLVSMYKACVKQATTFSYDKNSPPEAIVRQSFNNCRSQRASMLKDYPRRWHEGLIKEVDDQLYKDEIAWITNKRN